MNNDYHMSPHGFFSFFIYFFEKLYFQKNVHMSIH